MSTDITERPPKVSVVIPCFNYGRYLLEAIDSVLASTFLDLEILVVDDGSTDPQTLLILDGLARPKTRVIRQANKGLPAARNAGFREAVGKYVLPLDADDKITPTLIEKAYWVLESRPSLGFVSCWLQHFGQEQWVWAPEPYNLYRLLHGNMVTVTSLVRRKAWEMVGGFDESMVGGYEDWEFWIRLGARGWHGFRIPEPLFLYRKHGASMITEAEKRHPQLVEAIRQRHPWLYSKIGLGLLRRRWEEGFAPFSWLERERLRWARKAVAVLRRLLPSELVFSSVARRVAPEAHGFGELDYSVRPVAEAPLQVLCVFPWLDMGGADRVHLDLVAALVDRGIAVTVVTTLSGEDPWFESFSSLGVEIFRLGVLGFDEMAQVAILKRLARSRAIDVLIVGNSDIGFSALSELKCCMPTLATLALVHNHVPESPRDFVRMAAQKASSLDGIFTVSHAIRAAVQDLLTSSSPWVHCVPNGVDLEKFRKLPEEARQKMRRKRGWPVHGTLVGFIGRLSPEKGARHFVQAAIDLIGRPEAASLTFLIAGDGQERSMLRAKVDSAGIGDRCTFLGAVDRIWEILPLLDLLVAPSEFEGLPLVGLEAMASSVPILATNVRGWRDLIRHGENGWLMEYGSLHNLGDHILEAVSSVSRPAIAERAAHFVMKDHDLRLTSSMYLDLISKAAIDAGMADGLSRRDGNGVYVGK